MKKTKEKNDEAGDRPLDDIKTIKELLMRVEKKHLVEPWSYFIWGAAAAVGGVVHFLVAIFLSPPGFDYLLVVWAPVIAVGAFFESMGFIRRMAKESMPLLSRISLHLFVSFIIICLVFLLILLVFLRFNAHDYVPMLLALYCGTCFIGYALISCPPLLLPAFFLVLAGLLLFVFAIPDPWSILVMGTAIGTAFAWGGIMAQRSARQK